MSDPITLGLASTAVSLVNGTISLLKEAKEAAKRSDDHDLKDKLSEVFDSVLDLKEVIANLRDDNAELRKQLEARAKLLWDRERKIYFAEDDPDPFCPICLDGNNKQIRLQPTGLGDHLLWRYECKVCRNFFAKPED